MEPEAQADYSPGIRNRIDELLGIRLEEAQDLNGFENFVYGVDETVVRITHKSHRTKQQLLAEIEFLQFLGGRRGSVVVPLPVSDGSFVSPVGNFHVCRFTRAKGKPLAEGFSDAVIEEWGRCIGEFHRLARDFRPLNVRQDWLADENHQFRKRIPAAQNRVLAAADSLMRELMQLPVSPLNYGLIHSDAHAGNFLADEARLTFFDFDDSLYAWYGYDVASILFGLPLQAWVEDTPEAKTQVVESFLPVFLRGYDRENDRAALMLDQMPLLLKLREFSLYAAIYAHMGSNLPTDGYAGRFMRGRRQRLEAEIAYLDFGML